ncbi:unnamed protein product [marine sediment metagenome]|uniref:Uncharacterized protein n=1 Tax=marine sediment metagenome TaxID=412755 RepID=X0U6Y3_9ZZZZ
MDNTHYDSFVAAVDNRAFDSVRIGDYLRDIRERAKYIQSPIEADSIFEAFGLSQEDFGKYTSSYVGKALAKNKAIPLEELVCVEDDFSAVFIENDPEEDITLRVTIYKDEKEFGFAIDGVVYYGKLKWFGLAREKNYFEALDFYVSLVFDDYVKDISKQLLDEEGKELVNATTTVIEQLAYMEREGLLRDIK